MLFSPGTHPLLPHVLRSYLPLRVTSHTPPEQNPLCSRQTSLSQMPQITAPYSLGGTAQLPKRLQVSQGTVLVTWKPSNKHTGGEPLLTASDGPAAAPSASQRQLMHASRYLPQLIKSKMRGCGPILVLAGVRGRCSHNSITNTSWPTATTRRAD